MIRVGLFFTVGLMAASWIVPLESESYDKETHQVLGEQAARMSLGLERVLRGDLAYRLITDLPLKDGTQTLSAQEWIGVGSREEDEPSRRSLRHFHNPLLPWSSAGLSFGPVSGMSSVLWAQNANQDPTGTLGGAWSWNVAREAYLGALIAEAAGEREAKLARTLRALGHITHLIQDASVPAHVRNDAHPSFEIWNIRIPINPDPYEETVHKLRRDPEKRFDEILSSLRLSPSLSVFRPTGDERAPVPIAGLIDTQNLRLGGLVRGVFDPLDVGIAELVNAGYLSGDTIFKDFALPRSSQLGTPFFESRNGRFRRYWPKMEGAAIEIAHFVTEGVLYESLFDVMPQPPGIAWVLDDVVALDYAADLLPRAVGYSAALIDYFFRGRLDVDVVDNAAAGEPSQLRVVGLNASEEPLVSGKLLLFADDVSGKRTGLEPVSGSIDDAVVRDVGPGADLASTWFKGSQGAERFVAVYHGALGDEPEAPSPGAVIGKVLGGVRVEHVFADGDHWKIRTPTGVFTLPLTTAEFQEVKWGGGVDVLVARTWFGEGLPNRFASFAVQRRPGSIDLVTDATSGMLTVSALATAEFPFGLSLGTDVAFDQVIHYRQRLSKINPYIARWRWVGPGGMDYGGTNEDEAATPTIEEVSRRSFTFTDAFTILLDPAHNLQFNLFGAERYLWDVFGVSADADGRLFATIQVLLMDPSAGSQSVDFLGISRVTEELEKHATVHIRPIMPIDVGPIWALLDLGTSRIVASSVGTHLSVVSELKAEAPPFANPSYVRVGRFEPLTAPGVWIKQISVYEGGSLAGVVAEDLWTVRPLVPHREDDGSLIVRAEIESSVGIQTLSATGLRREDLSAVAPVTTSVEITQSVRDMALMAVNGQGLHGIRVATSDGVVPESRQFFDVRTWGATGVPKLTFLTLESDAAGGATHVITWDHEAGRAIVVADLGRGSHGLSAATSSVALVNSYLGPDFEPAGFVVRLDESRPPLSFLGESMWSFSVLEPSYLYNADDMRFYRLNAPLQRTALPAPLAGTADISGDFHAVRLP